MISSADQTFDLKLEPIDSGVLMICKNKQKSVIVLPHVLHKLKLREQVIDTTWLFNTGQDYRIRSTGTSPRVTATLNRHDHFIDFKIRVI